MKLIYDIGAHIGKDSLFYLQKGFNVVAVEANPYCCAEIKKRLGGYIRRGRLHLVEGAISEELSPIDFLVNVTHHDWGTVDPRWNEQYDSDIVQVKATPVALGSLLDCQFFLSPKTPYYMKIDIEGGDAMCIRQLKGRELPKYISAELLTFNNFENKNTDPTEVITALLDVGYTKFKIVDQSLNHETKCPKPSKEGKYVDYEFDGYCSGLFGKELPGDWVDIEDILFQYIHYFYEKPNCIGESLNEEGWFDLHATY